MKYPELFGIKHGDKMGNSRKAVEASPNWCISPPKTCVLLEPSDDDKVVVIKDVEINLHKPRDKGTYVFFCNYVLILILFSLLHV